MKKVEVAENSNDITLQTLDNKLNIILKHLGIDIEKEKQKTKFENTVIELELPIYDFNSYVTIYIEKRKDTTKSILEHLKVIRLVMHRKANSIVYRNNSDLYTREGIIFTVTDLEKLEKLIYDGYTDIKFTDYCKGGENK